MHDRVNSTTLTPTNPNVLTVFLFSKSDSVSKSSDERKIKNH